MTRTRKASNRAFVMYINAGSAPALLGVACGAMNGFMHTLPARIAITYTAWPTATEAPLLHQHAVIQPSSGDEVYGRVLAGLDPNCEII